MKKEKQEYLCSACGYRSARWLGRCPQCQAWETMELTSLAPAGSQGKAKAKIILYSIQAAGKPENTRFSCGLPEIDQLMGGGFMPGSVILLGGDPGVGKSTLALQLLNHFSNGRSFYVSAEESGDQILQRAERLGITNPDIRLLITNELEEVVQLIEQENPGFLIIDSIQTLRSSAIENLPGTPGQIRFIADRLTELTKQRSCITLLIGHVTKDGSLAGPKLLEHLVDTVLYFEGDQNLNFRILRTTKNRFGAVNNLTVFQMNQKGLEVVSNPSLYFLDQHLADRTGVAIVPTMQGVRSLLIEVQALASKTHFGAPQRTAYGIDHKRLSLLLAVLDKKLGFEFGFFDVFCRTSGGLSIQEPAIDLALVVALISSIRDQPVKPDTVFIGEVGLNGEVRGVSQLETRLREAARLGFRSAVVAAGKNGELRIPDLKIIEIQYLNELQGLIFHRA